MQLYGLIKPARPPGTLTESDSTVCCRKIGIMRLKEPDDTLHPAVV